MASISIVNQSKKLRFWHNIAQSVITSSVVLIVFAFVKVQPIFAYHSGLENGNGGYTIAMLWIPVFTFLLVCSLLLLQLIALIVFKALKRKECGFTPLLLFFVSLITIVIWPFLLNHVMNFTEGFREKTKSEVNAPEVQKWLRTLKRPIAQVRYIVDPCSAQGEQEFYGHKVIVIETIDSADWPATLRTLRPEPKMIDIQPYNNQEATIRLEWSFVFASWGMVIGPPDMEIPESDMRRGGEYRLEFAPGAYVWYRIK
jgi:hypothetical protein